MLSVEKMGGSHNLYHAEFRGNANDMNGLNPKDIPNGSTFLEIKTSKLYMFDKEDGKWYLQKSGGGSGDDGLPIYLWVSGTRYEVDDIVIKDGNMYICTVANSDVEWNSNHWSAIGSSDGNYGVVDTVANLPTLTSSDRKIYFVEEDELFHYWDGTEWDELTTQVENITTQEIDDLFD